MNIDLNGRRVALIGGAGFIGHSLALALAQQGAEPEVIDGLQVNSLGALAATMTTNQEQYLRFIYRRLELLHGAGIPVHVQDARDYGALSRTLGTIKPHIIVHLAAVAHAGRSNKDPYSTFDHSLRTLENALDSARGNVEHFIFMSSSMAYGHFETPIVDETHPLNPLGIYGALKLAGEKIVQAYGQVFDLPYTIVRPSALYGPRCVSRRVVQVFIENAILEKPLRINGEGLEKLDFTYIKDLVRGLCQIMGCEAAKNEVFNLTYGDARSILDLVEIIRASFPEVVVEFEDRDKLQPFRGTLSIEKARRVFGFNPLYPIEKGLPEYVSWYRKYHHDVRTTPLPRTPRLSIVSQRKPVELAPKTFGGSELFW